MPEPVPRALITPALAEEAEAAALAVAVAEVVVVGVIELVAILGSGLDIRCHHLHRMSRQ
jgi:hypothetical protein